MKRSSQVVCRVGSREICLRAGLGLISGMCALLCVSSLFTVVSADHTPLSVVANSSGQEFHPAHILSLSRSSMSSSSKDDFIHGEEIQEKEVLNHFFRNGRRRNIFHKPSTTFMVSLFNRLQRGGAVVNESSGTTTDTIRSFSGQRSKDTRKARLIVDFYIPPLPSHEKLRRAEIRFLRHPTNQTKSRRYKFRIDVRKRGKIVRRIVLRGRSNPQSQHDVFDVTKIVSPWINSFHGNIIFHVKVSKRFESQAVTSDKDKSLQSMSLIVLYLDDSQFLTSLYAGFASVDDTSDAEDTGSIPGKTKRTLLGSVTTVSNSSTIPFSSNSAGRERRNIQKNDKGNRKNRKWFSKSKGRCQLHDFEVDFNVIGWGKWIMHPKKFNARFCSGVCPSPIDVQYKPTNHALLQTLMRMKRPQSAPPPCCVPIKLKPISMLYFEYDEIVVRHHDDMIASECGCR
ncbi:unnamed protein product [Candidula unifasciata]|uniref:TGF-beta family profile domain-containing protein n=1 Tax=Candidula unifasciata TaxID=100452 RepID=A0A8S3ZR38_9EUPU|nr:unnamed protein product [Candidula unifasciata]